MSLGGGIDRGGGLANRLATGIYAGLTVVRKGRLEALAFRYIGSGQCHPADNGVVPLPFR